MQRHKRWLVITIWISTIAFVGAGFVGWGSYNYGSNSGSVAVVGDREISVEEFQEEYSTLYNQYARMFGSSFNQEMADRLNLRDAAYNQIVQKNLILSYGDSLGLDVTDEDIAKELLKYDAFLKDGKFDKPTYIKVLAQNRMKPIGFEETLKRNILLQKIQRLFVLEPNSVEIENLSKLLFVQDNINIKILNNKDVNITVNEDELKKYWEENKNSYLSEIKYVLQVSKMPIQSSKSNDVKMKSHYDKFRTDYKKEDGKIKSFDEAKADVMKDLDKKFTKKEALKKYLKIKKGEVKLEETVTYSLATLPFANENSQKITSAKIGDLLKPVYRNGEYQIIKLINKIDATPLSYAEAKPQAKVSFEEKTKQEKIIEIATKESKTFKGTNIKNVSRESIDKIKGLQGQEAAKFLNELFSSESKEGFINLGDKIVLYRVNSSKLGTYDKSRDETVKSTLAQLQEQELMSNLIKNLENRFEVQSSIDTKEK
jgi:peptidyl-prolyl cis-trans isomerase D